MTQLAGPRKMEMINQNLGQQKIQSLQNTPSKHMMIKHRMILFDSGTTSHMKHVT